MSVCSFTGHRPQKLPFGYLEDDERCVALKARLREAIEQEILSGTTTFLTGMAQGVDTYAAEIVLSLKKEKYPELLLYAILPCDGQSKKWRIEAQRRYQRILSECARCYIMAKEYTPDCMYRRNRFLVDHSDAVIAVWDGTPGGTFNTILYAKRAQKRVVQIDI